MCLNKLKFRMKNMKSIAWQAGCLLWLGMAVCNCTPASSGEDYASYVNPFIGTGGGTDIPIRAQWYPTG